MKLGKHPATPRTTDFKFKEYRVEAQLPYIPTHFGFDHAVTDWGVLGNADYGDCVWAGACHEHMLLTATQSPLRPSPTESRFTDDNALAAYAAVTGFDRTDPSTDQGTNVHDALSYRQHTGIMDATGKTHKIGAYVSLEPGNMKELYEALYIFQCVGIGFEFPDSAMHQFNTNQPWTVVDGSQIEGGHYVMVASKWYDTYIKVITWGRLQTMSDEFYKKYCDEAWCYIAPDMLNAKGQTARGFNLAALQQDLSML